MKRMLLLVILGLALCVRPAAAGDGEESVRGAIEKVRTDLAEKLNHPVPGIHVLIDSPKGKFYVSAADGEYRTTSSTNFRFASCTKTFTAGALLKMQQDGWLHIDQHITELIPGTQTPLVPDTQEWAIPYKDRITIRQLLQHSAGVYDVDSDMVPGCEGISYTEWVLLREPAHQFAAAEMVAQAALRKLSYFMPGEGHHYSNTGYSILGEIIARAYTAHMGARKTYGDYIKDHMTGGLPLHFPELADDSRLSAPFVKGVTYEKDSTVPEISVEANLSAQVAEGNGWGTPEALDTWLRRLMKGEGPLNAQSIAMMKSSVSPGSSSYGLGCLSMPNLGYGHNGCRVGYLSLMMYDPETDVSVVAYLNLVDMSRRENFTAEMTDGLYQAGWSARAALGYPGRPGRSANTP